MSQHSEVRKIIRAQYKRDKVCVIGLTGQAGAGKTATAEIFQFVAVSLGIPLCVLGLDSFFRFSSAERKRWLEEGKRAGKDEYDRRCDQMTWWNFEQARRALDRVRECQKLKLSGIYNRADRGEKTGQISIHLPAGGLLVFEGVAVAHLRATRMLDYLVLVCARDYIRRERLQDRDASRRQDAAAAEERWRITEKFEHNYFKRYGGLADVRLDNNWPATPAAAMSVLAP